MSSRSKKDLASSCMLTFSDGRRCRTPRTGNHPHFCFDHAQKEARARTAETLGKDLAYFFSGDYLSACDLSSALARLIPAVVRGDIKPKTARTVAYLAQTLLQSIRLAQHEYINAFSSNGWRNSVRNSVNSNHDYLFPPDPEPKQPEPPQPQRAARSVETPANSHSERAETPVNCHSERSEESAFSESQPDLSQIIPTVTAPPHPACHPERSEGSCLDPVASTTNETHPIPATQPAPPLAPTTQPVNPPPTAPSTPRPVQNWGPLVTHFDATCRLFVDGKPF